MRKDRFIELNLSREILEGWEHYYDSLNVDALRIAHTLGHKFPAVDVVLENGVYRLAFGKPKDWIETGNYGGHSRAVLAFQEKYPLNCRVLNEHRQNPQGATDIHYYPTRILEYRPISQMQPKRDISFDSLYRLGKNLEFLPEKLKVKFVEEHALIYLEDGVLEAKENIDNPPAF